MWCALIITIGAAASKPDAAFDPDDRIADVHVAADRIPRSDRLQRLDRGDAVVETLAVESYKLALFERQRHAARLRFFQLRRVSLFGSVSLDVRVSLPPTDVPQIPWLIEYSAFLKSKLTPCPRR